MDLTDCRMNNIAMRKLAEQAWDYWRSRDTAYVPRIDFVHILFVVGKPV